ncbi:MAG: hypothetical protein IJA08_06215 [Clostridia bacterium]|nr:hypothetical protein [Clostridia bacterium]
MYQVPKRRRTGFFLFIIFLCCACAVGFGIGFAAVKIKNNPPADPIITMENALAAEEIAEDSKNVSGAIDVSESNTKDTASEEYYFVKSVDSEVLVYLVSNDDKMELIKKLPVTLSDLPKSDREKLASGIKLVGKTALAELIEDYCS